MKNEKMMHIRIYEDNHKYLLEVRDDLERENPNAEEGKYTIADAIDHIIEMNLMYEGEADGGDECNPDPNFATEGFEGIDEEVDLDA